ncbi:unnamed protein product [Rodentolepis nana]|uniref:Protein kinase domain-containing protein n=1 Tax=Rodentolepis nana TaxID=102285 RepID=A0A0R3U0X1_RODNA|nr:unnamed protein product [Rodentolepis nana]
MESVAEFRLRNGQESKPLLSLGVALYHIAEWPRIEAVAEFRLWPRIEAVAERKRRRPTICNLHEEMEKTHLICNLQEEMEKTHLM